MAAKECLTIFLLSHDPDGAAQSVPVPRSAGGRRRPVSALAAEWLVKPQNTKPRLSKSIGHLYQQFRLAVCASTMCEYNGLSSGPRWLVEPALNGGVTVKVFKKSSHETVNRLEARKASLFPSRNSLKFPAPTPVQRPQPRSH